MESSLQNLNAPQREAATTIDEHVRIIAGAGSGKTRVLMARIAYLVNEVGILPWRIMAITFTNKAANEMKERLSKELGEDAQKVKISTIHASCVRILREDAHLIGYPKSFTIMDRDDQKTVIKKLYKIKHIKNDEIPANSLIAYISNNKSADVPVEMAQRLA
ncbi:UvrD-helicase domain-containing protein, partial [Dubosiella newyorkensis]